MVIEGTGEHLTDAQWLTLMNIVSDDAAITLKLPKEEGADAVLLRDRKTWQIHADGSAHWKVFGGGA